ncbi:hypothetical protein [Dialister invisus]|uniref:hypothetical protein n=1 Tax=Dialister invisus TaxID=218538 RepID=UPI00267741FE|nr:hypothetical protein [Dialister invisus]
MLIKALEKIIINGTIIDAGETYDGTAEELAAYVSGGYVEVLEQDEDAENDHADNQNEEVEQEDEEPEEIPEEIPEEKPKTTRRTVRRTKKTGA